MPRDGAWLDQIQWEHRPPNYKHPEDHILFAYHPDHSRPVGHISWFDDDGEVAGIDVHHDHRRKGLATHMWNRAKQITPHLMHSQNQTPDGQAWAPKVSRRTAVLTFTHHEMTDPGYHRIIGHTEDDRSGGMLDYRQHHDGRVVHFEPQFTRGNAEHEQALLGELHRLHPDAQPHTPRQEPAEAEPTTWYHGTVAPRVKRILPANAHRKRVTFPHETDRDHAYATSSHDDAWAYAEKAWHVAGDGVGRPRVYEVAPRGSYEPDPRHRPDGTSRGNNSSDYRSKEGWDVVREVPMPEHMGSPKDWR